MTRRPDGLDLVALMAAGVHYGEHPCVVALGIGIDGTKCPLAFEEGSTQNAILVTDLITGPGRHQAHHGRSGRGQGRVPRSRTCPARR